MLNKITDLIAICLSRQVSAYGLGVFRIFYGLVMLQEIVFLLYFNHLIFDPIPYMDVEFPMITFFLGLWAIVALFMVIGYRTQWSIVANYFFWIIFVSFTPMQRDFDGGFDQFMIGVGLFLIFLPVGRIYSIDNLRYKLASPELKTSVVQPVKVTVLAYTAPVIICLGFLYLDSAIHKLFSEHWWNGMGAWLPSSMPYYISAIDLSWWLDREYLQRFIGYTVILFQFSFLPLYFSKSFRPVILGVGIMLHLGITLSLNIYPFGLGMLALYPLLVPFSWWRHFAVWLLHDQASLTVYYDDASPLCNRTAIIINHFDVCKAIDFKSLQTESSKESALQSIAEDELLNDLYAVDEGGNLYSGLDTYIRILEKMRYTFFVSLLLRLPGLYGFSTRCYRRIADHRSKVVCDAGCAIVNDRSSVPLDPLYRSIFEQYASLHPRRLAVRLARIFVFIIALQLNSTLHYGAAYRFGWTGHTGAIASVVEMVSNSLLTLTTTFLGITPHALYLHDHFEGYNHLIGIAYLNRNKNEQWLPFVNEEGRMLAPNWGRVHSMWANIAVTPNIDNYRLARFIKKITAFWGYKLGLDLNETVFIVKLKKIRAPVDWQNNLRQYNIKQPWEDIGSVRWSGKDVTVKLPSQIDDM